MLIKVQFLRTVSQGVGRPLPACPLNTHLPTKTTQKYRGMRVLSKPVSAWPLCFFQSGPNTRSKGVFYRKGIKFLKNQLSSNLASSLSMVTITSAGTSAWASLLPPGKEKGLTLASIIPSPGFHLPWLCWSLPAPAHKGARNSPGERAGQGTAGL